MRGALPTAWQRGVFVRARDRLTYANVMATIAVFGVLAGGGAYAASKIGTSDIDRHAVTHPKLAKDSVRPRCCSLDARCGAVATSCRVRGDEHVETTHEGVPYPLPGASWTQSGDALNLVYGKVVADIPPGCGDGPSTPEIYFAVDISLDGGFLGRVTNDNGTFGPFLIWEPGETRSER